MAKAATIAPLSRSQMFVLPPKREKTSPPDNPLVGLVQSLLEAAREYRDQHLGIGDRAKAYRSWYMAAGESWGRKSTTHVNLIYEKVESVAADCSEADPTLLYTPRGPQDLTLVEFLNHVVPYVWDSEEATGKYHAAIKSACLYGTAYWKIVHDPGFPNTGPRIRIQCPPIWSIFPAPYAVDFEDCPYIIEVRPRTVGEIKAEYGVTVEPEIVSRESDPATDLQSYYPSAVPVETATGGSTVGGDVVAGYYKDLGSYADSGVVFQVEAWFRDGSRVWEWAWEENLDSPVPDLVKKPALKYPEGRVISIANGRLLYDRPSPYKDGEFPYVRFRDGTLPDFWYGEGEVEPLIPLQMAHDDTHEVIKLHHLFTVFGHLVVDTGTGLEEGQFENEPNQILWVNPGTADRIKWLQGLPPSPELYNYLTNLERSMDRVSGRFDITRGEQPGSVTAARALVTLQQAANIRIRHRMKDIERALKRAGHLLGSRVQQFWPSEMSVAIGAPPTSKEDRVFKTFALTPEDRQAKYNVKVAATANLSQLKQAEFQRVLLLHAQGLIDDETLIEAADLTQQEEILQKLPAVKMQHMMQQMLQQQAGAKPPPDQARAGNEADQQSRRQRANTRATTPAQ